MCLIVRNNSGLAEGRYMRVKTTVRWTMRRCGIWRRMLNGWRHLEQSLKLICKEQTLEMRMMMMMMILEVREYIVF